MSETGGKVEKGRRRGARLGGSHGTGAAEGVCVRCGRTVDLAAMVQWRDGMGCLRCTLEILEEEQHGTELERRRELHAIDAERAAAVREALRQERGDNMVRGW